MQGMTERSNIAFFKNCFFKANATYGIMNNGHATFINCKLHETGLRCAEDKSTKLVAIGCELLPPADQMQFPYVGAMTDPYETNIILIGNTVSPEADPTKRQNMCGVNSAQKGDNIRLIALGNLLTLGPDLTYLKNSVLVGNRNITNGDNLIVSTPSAAQAKTGQNIVDNHYLTYSNTP